MNLERGFSAPQQKGNFWVPATPEKALVGMQQGEKAEENWEELLGIYTGVLKDETCSELPQECISTNLVLNQNQQAFAPDSRPPDHVGLSCGVGHVQNVAFVGSHNGLLPQIPNPTHVVGVNHRGHSTQDTEKFTSFNQNATSMGSNLHNKGDADRTEVYSLAELMGIKSGHTAPKQTADRITCAVDKPSSISPHSQVERNWKAYGSDSTVHLQNHILQANQDVGGYSVQQIPTSRLSVAYRPSYNLNLSPRSEAGEYNSAVGPIQQGPATPDKQKLQENNNILQVPYFSIDAVSAKENNKQDNVVLPPQADIGGRERNSFAVDSLGALPAAVSTEKQNIEGRDDGEIDLNKTPPQKTPKRRKHRPKVVKEGKPKRTPKPKATEHNTPGGNSTTKRKYVRKKGIKTSTDQSNDATNGVDVSNVEPQPKSCKRALNFDLENVVEKKIKGRENDHQADNVEGSKLNLNVDFHSAEGKSTFSVKNVQNICSKGKPTENLYDFIHSVDKITPQEFTVPPTASKDRTLNVLARIMNVQYANTNQSGGQGMNEQVRHHIVGDLAQILANTRKQQLDGNRQPKHLNMPQLLEDSVDVSEKQESKRECSYTDMTQPLTVPQIWPHGVSDTGHYNRETIEFWQNCLEASRTEDVEDQIYGRKSSIPSGNTTAEHCSEQIQSTLNKSIRAECSKLQLNGGLSYVSGEGKSTFIDLTNDTNMVIHPRYMNSSGSGNKFKKQVNSYAEQMAHRAHHLAKAQTTSSLTAVSNCHMMVASQRDSQVTKGNEIVDSPARLSIKRQAARQMPSNIISKNLQGSGHDSKVTGPSEYKRNTLSIDFITNRMKDLHIDDNGKETVRGEHNALVPYRGDGDLVPFEVFDPIKKRQPRPKVDLDPETNRLWNLLMGKERSERAETKDNGTQKNWEEERKVFRGRVDSFIARMHLVQGDRRFSKWKGSVVDSVIGVFLTQNVSDHLSSSAFMSLAAKFPLKSTTMKGSLCQNRGTPSNEHEVIISYPDERTACHDPLAREPVVDHSSVTSSRLSQYKTENVISGKNFSKYNHTRRKEECMISSQSSSESASFQASDDIRSSSGSNSEVEDHVTGSSFRKTFAPLSLYEEAERIDAFLQYEVQEMGSSLADNKPSNDVQQPENLVQIQNPGVASSRNAYFYPLTSSVQHYQRPVSPSANYWQEMLMGVEERELDLLEFVGKECSSSMTSTCFDTTNGTGIEHEQDKARKSAESSLTDQQTRSSKFLNHKVINEQPEQQMNLPSQSQSRNGQHFINFSQRGKQETSQKEGSCITDPRKNAEAFRQKQDNQNPTENMTPEPTETKRNASNAQSSKVHTTSNARKRKAEKEKVEPFDWDSLRKHVESKAGTKGKGSNALDSLDYEALQNADVHEISKTIKERGMNNMLAERMKDFLNRLVKDHGSIDLEWLRDVQPDKAKDYLLSVRGLGLKSVECVRLLTLHHLAFPVDTNVGRIAVRLGWVPLQPLPETLQLHLLELYPVLESIQKYLWPRLCMLDQETLYELHYQLITFGKVFCTKRQPNCNACPMRGECRHFASAFASARLALPGPEERRIVCSDVPSSSSKSCSAVIKPMLLAPGGDNLGRTPEIMRNCEPIIEEPATPEASIEMSERDIEDAFFEDPDEIPEIKLNIDEFTSNLQSFIEEKMEMKEGDMSKALVALSPKFASIPTPKLKQVSRLRTEHQVYELPDSHPLLKGFDKREPDDPSPYLLAIWAPGETADSTEPPESKCSSSKGGPCNTKACFSCNGTREAEAQTVRGTILIPCRTAMRGSFPLNGTYFQVNEVFADNETSINPIDVPRSYIWNLARRTVFFGTSVSTIFKGMSTENIQYCFWKGFVCVRGFDQKTRAPRPLKARLHLAASRIAKKNE